MRTFASYFVGVFTQIMFQIIQSWVYSTEKCFKSFIKLSQFWNFDPKDEVALRLGCEIICNFAIWL